MSFMRYVDTQVLPGPAPSYGNLGFVVQTGRYFIAALAVFAAVVTAGSTTAIAQERPVKIVALGDSLTAGFGLPANQAFPAKLASALKAKGNNVTIVNAGVSGDTATGGLERLDWAVPKDADAVIVELGANDMLRGIPPEVTRKAIDGIVRLAPRTIVYIACDPATLARDCERLARAGYRATDAWPIDLMPQTAHVEVVVRLTAT